MHTVEPVVRKSIYSEVEIAIENLKSYKSLDTDQISAEPIQAGGNTLSSEIHKIY
jgi:hypothetical protein